MVHPLCLVRAAARRLARLRALGAGSPDGPLFPRGRAGPPPNENWVAMLERVLTVCRVGTHLVTGQGDVVPKFGGHAARVTGGKIQPGGAARLGLASRPRATQLHCGARRIGCGAAIREAVLRVAGANPMQTPSMGGVAGAVRPRRARGRVSGTGQDEQFPPHHAPSHSQGPPP